MDETLDLAAWGRLCQSELITSEPTRVGFLNLFRAEAEYSLGNTIEAPATLIFRSAPLSVKPPCLEWPGAALTSVSGRGTLRLPQEAFASWLRRCISERDCAPLSQL